MDLRDYNYKQKIWRWLIPSLKPWVCDESNLTIQPKRSSGVMTATTQTIYVERYIITTDGTPLDVHKHILAKKGQLDVDGIGLTNSIVSKDNISLEKNVFYLVSGNKVLANNWKGTMYRYS